MTLIKSTLAAVLMLSAVQTFAQVSAASEDQAFAASEASATSEDQAFAASEASATSEDQASAAE